jgi:DNA-binding response OmpR family regulator
MPIEPALAEWSVLLGVADTKMAASLSKIIRAEGIRAKFFSNMDEARTLIAKDRPSLAILEHDPPRIDGMDMCRAIRQQESDREHRVPVVIVAAQENQERGAEAGVTDWLIKPFNDAYARTKIRAWTLRAACQWMRGVIPEDDERRLARSPLHVQRAPMAQKGTGRFSQNVIRTDKSALLWMYCREIAPFETPAFSENVGNLIARATKRPSEMRNRSEAN